jgi:hypothetical protein
MDSPNRRVVGTALVALALATGIESAHAAHVQLSGLLDLVAAERGAAFEGNVLTRGDSPFDAYGMRVFADGAAGERLHVFAQVVLRDASMPYVDGAYAMYTPWSTRDVHLLAGKIAWPIGAYAPRTYSNKNPLIGAPLMYQYHSSLVWYAVPANADVLLGAAESGQTEVSGVPPGHGMPVIDDSYWDAGATIVGSARPFEFALGTTLGTPGWGNTAEDENAGTTVLGRIGVAPLAGVRLGMSGAYGPYLIQALAPALPPGASISDYHQELGVADAEFMIGNLELRGEGARNWWQSPFVGALGVTTGYGELKYALSWGGFVAGRWDAMRFSKVENSSGDRIPWDHDVTRIETGAGYRFDRNTVVKLVYQHTRFDTPTVLPASRTVSMVAAQLSAAF